MILVTNTKELLSKCNEEEQEEARTVCIDSTNEDQCIQSQSDTDAGNLDKSPTTEHLSVDSYICDTCGSIFNLEKKLIKHYYNCHSESVPVRPFVCKICEKSFKYKSKLEEHSVVHTEEKFVCPTH